MTGYREFKRTELEHKIQEIEELEASVLPSLSTEKFADTVLPLGDTAKAVTAASNLAEHSLFAESAKPNMSSTSLKHRKTYSISTP